MERAKRDKEKKKINRSTSAPKHPGAFNLFYFVRHPHYGMMSKRSGAIKMNQSAPQLQDIGFVRYKLQLETHN